MAVVPEPKEVVRRFLDHGSTADGWNMDVINECFSESYWSHTWQGDLATTGARQGRFFAALRVPRTAVERPGRRGRSRRPPIHGEAPPRRRGVRHPADGRVVTAEHVEMWRVTDGKIVEHWGGLGAGGQLYRALTKPDD